MLRTWPTRVLTGLVLMIAATVQGTIPSSERAALLELYSATNGDRWLQSTDWGRPVTTECRWYGVVCDAGKTTVLELHLRENNLNGILPASIDHLPNLRQLDLGDNELTGTIPTELANLTGLIVLDLGGNHLAGGVPPETRKLKQLEALLLDHNELAGGVPSELGDLSALVALDLEENQLSGPIPSALARLTNLTLLRLSTNQLTGSIPPELGDLVRLQELLLGTNQLTGTIPTSLGNLVQLRRLDLEWNELTGPIPAQLGNLRLLQSLNMEGNELDGGIPEALTHVWPLQSLNLKWNELTGPIPPDLSGWTDLATLDLSCNHLSGAIPPQIGSLTSLRELLLSNNLLTGAIPPELGRLANLRTLKIASNGLVGPIPPELGNLASLNTYWGIDVYSNGLWTNDPDLDEFISTRHAYNLDWHASQTVPPTYVAVRGTHDTSLWLTWSPIEDDTGPGSYEVQWAEAPGGDWHSAGRTGSKKDTRLPVTGLAPGMTYELRVRTVSEPVRYSNENRIVSRASAVVSTTTGTGTCATPTIRRTGSDPVELTVPGSFTSYLWSTGSFDPTVAVSPTEPTWYWVTVSWPPSCEETASVLVAPQGGLFADGFEEGDSWRWSTSFDPGLS